MNNSFLKAASFPFKTDFFVKAGGGLSGFVAEVDKEKKHENNRGTSMFSY